jgi:predicted nucleic acid-binding protein
MRALLDTSVLVPALVDQLPNHSLSLSLFLSITSEANQAFCSTHAIAEAYSVLTALPLARRITPAEAMRLIEESIIARLQIVELTIDDYRWALTTINEAGVTGGVFYDGLHLAAARKGGCKRIYTYNTRHFAAIASAEITVSLP